MRSLLLSALAAAALCLVASPSDAQQAAPPSVGNKVTFNVRGLPLRQAVNELFRGSGRQFSVDPDVPDVPITLSIKDTDFWVALWALLRPARARYWEKERNHFVIMRRDPAPAPDTMRVTVEWRQVPLRRALDELFRISGKPHAVQPDMPDALVSMAALNVPFHLALLTLVHAAGATYRKEGNIYVIGPRVIPEGEHIHTWAFKGTPMRQALQELLDSTGTPSIVESEVPNIPVYVYDHDWTPESVLYRVADLAGVTVFQDHGVGKLFAVYMAEQAARSARPLMSQPVARPLIAGRQVTLQLHQISPREAFAFLFDAAKEQCRIEPDLPDAPVSITVQDVSFGDVLRSLIRVTGTSYSHQGRTYVIRRAP